MFFRERTFKKFPNIDQNYFVSSMSFLNPVCFFNVGTFSIERSYQLFLSSSKNTSGMMSGSVYEELTHTRTTTYLWVVNVVQIKLARN